MEKNLFLNTSFETRNVVEGRKEPSRRRRRT
jgi:hypothetical protein